MRLLPGSHSTAAGLAAILTLLPFHLGGQAICSAPHSSPTLAQSGSIRTLPTGGGWIQLSAYGQRATESFNTNGDRQPFLASSEFDTRSLYFTGAVGIRTGLELWAQIPLHSLDVESAGGDSRTSGLGDIRVAARLGSELIGLTLPISLRLGAKIPGSEFPVDATVLPLTEGQLDWEISLESGHRLENRSVYVLGWAGYRWRRENEEAAREPGDELFASLAAGGAFGNLTWQVTGDLLWGGIPLAQGFPLPGDKRRLIQILPTIGVSVGPGQLEATGQVPIWGQNLPVGLGISLGYRMSWGLEPSPVADLRDFFGG